MKTFLIWAVIVVASVELGGMAFDCLQRNIEADMAALHEVRIQKLEERINEL